MYQMTPLHIYISPSIDGQQLEQGHDSHELSRANQCFGCSNLGEGEGVRVNPNIVRIVMHIGIYGQSLKVLRCQATYVDGIELNVIQHNQHSTYLV